ncbi:MAG TPA: cytochrome c oxidase assembly protein [Galbitalea sp.]|nr:cytochrome c oxidase assembly protein [Galbitalea sp.]
MPQPDSSMPGMSGTMWMPSLPPTFARLIAWHPQPVPILPTIAVLLLAGYILGVVMLRRRGVRWPIARSIWWVAGVATILAVTATGVDGYGMELFSVHMVQHMVLSMLTPIFLALGAPITLIIRALPTRHGGGWNARKVFLAVLHSRVASFLTHPAVTVSLFLVSLYGLYFTPVFDALMSTMWGHNLMLIHFLAIGYLYFWGVMGVDPSPRRATRGIRSLNSPILRILEMVVTVPFHAFFGVVVMMSVDLIVGFYAHPNPTWHISALSDQQLGGGIAWGFTEIPTLVVLGVLFWQWQLTAARHDRVADRKADSDGDAELSAYNARLQSFAVRDQTRGT